MNKLLKAVGKFLLSILATMFLVTGIKIAVDGCWLIFLPIDEQVESVTISYSSLSPDAKEISDSDDLKRCTAMLNLLKYNIFVKSEDDSAPLVTYIFHQKNGSELVVAANNETVFYNGKQHVLKQPEVFVNLTEGLFFGRIS